jgi:hypothetical protein
MKNTMSIVVIAIRSNPSALQYASYMMQNNKQIIMENMTTNAQTFKFASKEIQNDYDVALHAIKIDENMFMYVSPRLKCDRKIVQESITNRTCRGNMFNFADDKFKNDPEMCTYAEIAHLKDGSTRFLRFSFQDKHLEKAKNYGLFAKQMKTFIKNKTRELIRFNIVFNDVLCNPCHLLNRHGKHMLSTFEKNIRQFLCPTNVRKNDFKRVFVLLR